MLVSKGYIHTKSNLANFSIGQLVKVKVSGRLGRVVAKEGSNYRVQLDEGGVITCNSGNLSPRSVLMEG